MNSQKVLPDLAQPADTITWDAWLGRDADPAAVALASRVAGAWREMPYAELRRRVELASSGLMAMGVEPGDRIAILAESRPEWAVAFFAALRAGAVVVPLDSKLTTTELAPQIGDAEPRVLFTSAALHDKKAEDALAAAPRCLPVLLDTAGEADCALLDDLEKETVRPAAHRRSDDVAVVTYTSGTTGEPKGVMTTLGNLDFEVRASRELFAFSPRHVYLSILPLNHLFELTGGLLAPLSGGAQVCYSDTLYPEEIASLIRERGVTRMMVVPLFLRLLKGAVERRVEGMGPGARRAFHAAFRLAGVVPSRGLRRGLFGAVHRGLGGTLREFCSGGAALDDETARFFDRLGFAVYQGYGLTETSPAISVNSPRHSRAGSVGLPLRGVEVRIAGDGEVLTRGPHVMRGYYRRDDLTREAVDADGWLHTGDLGRLDADGYLYITGRTKSLIVLGGGKKVMPEEVEARLESSPLIAEACVVGRRATTTVRAGTEEVWAVVVPDDPATAGEVLDREVERVAKELAPYKRPAHVVVRRDALPRTTTRKVKRAAVREWLDRQEENRS